MSKAKKIMGIYTKEEVAKHNTPEDAWIIIEDSVYNVSKFSKYHPGGKKILQDQAGKDCTEMFTDFHKWNVLQRYQNLKIGTLKGYKAPKGKKVFTDAAFGELVPYADPTWYQDWHSPYYKESHRRLRKAMREFVDREITPNCHKWDESKKIPKTFFRKAYEAGWLPGLCGTPWPTEYAGGNIAGGVDPKEYDYFHELIIQDEICRAGSGGVIWCLLEGLNIGLPPIRKFGSEYLKKKVVRPCLTGEKVICLALTEPAAGSDVAGFTTTAKKSPCGKYYIVNGTKKWITNGTFADYFTTAVRTGEKRGELSFLLIERDMPGVITKQMKCTGVWPSGTAYIMLEDVKVPVENLIGEEGKGFKYIVTNFNHERWGFIVQSTRFSRVCYEESLKFANQRKVFGHKLIDEPVIRNKLGHMVSKIEASQASLENITHQMNNMNLKQRVRYLAGPIAIGKVFATQTFKFCADEALQIFGGRGYTRGGQGEKVERLYREVKAYAIPGGSEEVMLDLGVRQAMKYLPPNPRL